jgi:endonuclease IV
MKLKTETFEMTLKDKKIKVTHQGFKLFKEQEKGLDQVKECIEESISQEEKKDGFIPYNNFECSVSWKLI